MFEGKEVGVMGGGKWGMEGGIEVGGMVNEVSVVELAGEVKGEEVLEKGV